MGEGLLHTSRGEVVEVANEVVGGLPNGVLQAACQIAAGTECAGPGRHAAIVTRRTPFARLIVNPDGSIGGVACRENGCLHVGRNAVYDSLALGGHFEFIANGRNAQVFRRSVFARAAHALVSRIGHAEHGAQCGAVHPFRAHDAVVRGCCSRGDCRCGAGAVGVGEGILRLLVDEAFAQQPFPSLFAIEWHEGFEIVRAQLVHQNVDDQPRNGRALTADRTAARHTRGTDGHQQRKQHTAAQQLSGGDMLGSNGAICSFLFQSSWDLERILGILFN